MSVVGELVSPFRQLHIALNLAVTDVRLQYRRSSLGPLWGTATLFAQISVIGLLFSRLFDSDTFSYLLHLGAGLVAWIFVIGTLNESSQSLISSGPLIRQIPLPVTVHTFRVVMKNVVLFAHNLLALVPFFLLATDELSFWMLLVIPGFLLALLNLSWLAIVLSVVSARYRDFPAIVSGVLVIVFYVTPILWSLEQLEGAWVQRVVPFNPFFHVVEVFREPLLGNPIPVLSATVLFLTALGGWGLARAIVARKSSQIAFWV